LIHFYKRELSMSAPDHSPSGVPLSPGEELEEEPAALSSIESTITARDSELSSLSRVAVAVSTILAEEEDEAGAGRVEQHDLQPVHAILVQLAVSLQARVDQAARDLAAIRHRLARELNRTADVLRNLGEVKLPSGFPASVSIASLSSTSSKHAVTIAAIHHYRDMAAAALESQSTILAAELPCQAADHPLPSDFNTASDRLDASFQQLRRWLDQLGTAARNLQSCDGESNTLRRFSSEQCRDIDTLEKEAVMAKMGELSLRNCSIQSRKPVRSLGHTLDLQEIMLLAKNAKSLVYEVSLQMLKVVDLVKGEEIAATTFYHRLTKENSELLRRYCFYLKLKIHQL
jgi:hypothetical protein